MSEFQAVILAAGRGSRMYPLTEDCPKALLPVGNRPLIWYPVKLLEENEFNEALVVVRDSQAVKISDTLSGFRNLRIKLSTVSIPESEDWGTADSLRHIRTKINADVILISCDLITTFPLRQLIDFHRVNDCTLTILLVRSSETQTKKDNPTEKDVVGLSGESRLVYFSAQADLDDQLTLRRTMLKRYPNIQLYTELLDGHLYLIKKWVVDHLGDNKELSSVKGELVPYLVQHQSLSAEATYTKSLKQVLQNAAVSSIDPLSTKSYEFSSFSGLAGSSRELKEDLIRCHALLLGSGFTTRVNTLTAFTDANRMISQHLAAFGLEKPTQLSLRSKGVSISPDSLVAASALLGEKISVKKSCVGEHASIAERSKVINCVIMDHVVIGEGCSLQSCVVCSHARLEDKVTLKDCYVGANFTITKEADMRGEMLVVGGGLHF